VIFVDFKTGHSPDDLCDIAPSYVTQMGLYARLLGEIFPDKRINASLIYTESPQLFWLTDDMLAEAVRTFFHNS
jgi:ATP-dependent helicase/nuclease subunit A